MSRRRMYCFIWILPVLINNFTPVFGEDLDCSPDMCNCNLDGPRPTVRCRGKSLQSIPENIPMNIKVLDLSNNDITRIEKDDLQNLEDLETLVLENNKMSYIHPRAFRNMHNLVTIILQNNELTSIPAALLQHLSKAKEINFNQNAISSISRYAFLTLNLDHDVVVKLSGNPIVCGCDMLALKHWLSDRNNDGNTALEIDDLKCANSPGTLPLMDMHDDDFNCDEDDPTVFDDDQECRTCDGVPSAEECNRSGTLLECDGDQSDHNVCKTSIRYSNNQLSVTKGCAVYEECVRSEQNNSETCTFLHNQDTAIVCNFCCVGPLCNTTHVGGRLGSYNFFLTLTFRDGIYDHDLSDPNSEKHRDLAARVKIAVRDALKDKLHGYFNVDNVSFGSPDLSVYLELSSEMFIQIKVVNIQSAILNAINQTINTPDTKLRQLNISKVDVSDQAPRFCPVIAVNTSKGKFVWPQTPVGQSVRLRCPHSRHNDRVFRFATRQCTIVAGMVFWMDPGDDDCPYASEMTSRLEDLSETEVTPENVLNVSKQLKTLLSTSETLKLDDIKFAVEVVKKIVNEASSLRSREIINNTLSAVSFILEAPRGVLVDSEKMQQATSKLLRHVTEILNNVPLSDDDDDDDNEVFKVMKPNLAIAAIRVDPQDFTGVAITADSSQAEDDSLIGGQVEIIRGRPKVKGSTISAIILPDSLFDSIRPIGTASVTRVTFSIYPTDKIFSVFEDARQGPSVNPTGRAVGDKNGSDTPATSTQRSSISNSASQNGGPTVTDVRGGDSTRQINSRILAATVPNVIVTNLSNPVIIHLPHLRKNADNPQCVYWKHSEWSSEGCWIQESVQDTYTTCACDHLTNFALLMDVYNGGLDISQEDKLALSIISYIGCGVSLMCLLLTLLTYCMFRKLRRDNPSKILVNLCIALAVANLIFIAGMQDYAFHNPVACKIVAVLLHYFLLSALTWMAVEAFYMYLALVLVFKTYFTNFILKCCVIGWGIPLVIIAITLGINSTENYGMLDSGICWIRNPAFYIAFLMPVAAILLLNFAAFGLVLRQLLGLSSRKLNKSDTTSTLTQLRGAVGVVILLGLTWVFAVFAIDQASIVFYYLFAITNSLQGLFIFLFYCLFKKDALTAWRRQLPCCELMEEKSADRTTSRGQSHANPGYSSPVSNNTMKQSVSSSGGSSDDVKQRGRGGQYVLARDSVYEKGDKLAFRTSTSI